MKTIMLILLCASTLFSGSLVKREKNPVKRLAKNAEDTVKMVEEPKVLHKPVIR